MNYHAGRCTVVSTAIAAGATAGGPFGMAGAPAVSALLGFVYPSYGLGRPRYPDEKHGRIKGAMMGAMRGSPGGFITSGFFVHGLQVKTDAGDSLLLRLDRTLSVPRGQTQLSSQTTSME